MSNKSKKLRPRVAGKMTVGEFMYRHTPLDAPSNDLKDQMDFNDIMHIGKPLVLEDLTGSPGQSKLRESVLNTNLDEMLLEIDALLRSSGSSHPNLKWVDALDQLYHDFLHRSKLPSPIYPGSPSPLSISSANSDLNKKRRRSPIKFQQLFGHIPSPVQRDTPFKKHKQNNKSSRRNANNKRPLTGSDIHRFTEQPIRRSQSSSRLSNNSKGSIHLSELNSV